MQKFVYDAEFGRVEFVPCFADGTRMKEQATSERERDYLPAASDVVETLTGTIYHDPEAPARTGSRFPSGRTSNDIYNDIASKVMALHKKFPPTNSFDIPSLNENNFLRYLIDCIGLQCSGKLVYKLVVAAVPSTDPFHMQPFNEDNFLPCLIESVGLQRSSQFAYDLVVAVAPPTALFTILAFDEDDPLPWLINCLEHRSDIRLIHELVIAAVMFPDDEDMLEEEVGVVLGLYVQQFFRPSDVDRGMQPKLKIIRSALMTMAMDLDKWAGCTDDGKRAAKAESFVFDLDVRLFNVHYLSKILVEYDVDPAWVLNSITAAAAADSASPSPSPSVNRELAELVDLFVFLLAFYPNPDEKHAERVRKLQEKTDIDDRTKSAIWKRVQELSPCLTAPAKKKFKVFDFLKPSA